MKGRIEIGGGVRGDERKIARIGQVDQPCFCSILDRVPAAGDLDVKPFREKRFEPIEISFGLGLLSVCNQARECALASRRQGDEARAQSLEDGERDVRALFDRAVQVSGRDQLAEVSVPKVVLREQDKPIDGLPSAKLGRACDR